jgi:hypothetical protein
MEGYLCLAGSRRRTRRTAAAVQVEPGAVVAPASQSSAASVMVSRSYLPIPGLGFVRQTSHGRYSAARLWGSGGIVRRGRAQWDHVLRMMRDVRKNTAAMVNRTP